MRINDFVENLAAVKLPNVFNPYLECCSQYDKITAPETRKEILLAVLLKAMEGGVKSLWIGRDLGYRGGRRTGLALTDEAHMKAYGERWGLSLAPVTIGPIIAEKTAGVIWHSLSQINESVFLWNVFPFHPHEAGLPFTNRSHNSFERKIGEEILNEMITMLNPEKIFAVGNDAASSLKRLSIRQENYRIRHPSFGGQNIFIRQVAQHYNLDGDKSFEDSILSTK